MIYTNEELKEFFKNLEANDKTKASYALRKLHPYSITKVLETLSEPFDREAVAERTAAKYKDTEVCKCQISANKATRNRGYFF